MEFIMPAISQTWYYSKYYGIGSMTVFASSTVTRLAPRVHIMVFTSHSTQNRPFQRCPA